MSNFKKYSVLLTALMLAACSALPGITTLDPATPTPVPATKTPIPPSPTPVPMAALVNGEGITLAEFNAELDRYKQAQTALGKTVDESQAAAIVLDDLIAQLLLAQAAQKEGFSMDGAALQARIDALAAQIGGADALKAWQSANGYSAESFRESLRRSSAAAWMRDRIVASVPSTAEQVHIRQILLYNEATALKIKARLDNGEDFDTLAAQVDPLARGDIGWFPRGYLSEKTIEEAAFALQPDQISDVVQSALGFHILKLIERDAAHPLSPDALLALQNSALSEWIAQARAQSNIVLAP
jgi:parvulin-like peptidyl-prolyl isomerase